VTLYLNQLNTYCGWDEPTNGGNVYAHEFMHDFPGLEDEYNDDPDPKKNAALLCPYSIMADEQKWSADLCTDLNHNPNTGDLCCGIWQGAESTWATLIDSHFISQTKPDEAVRARMDEIKQRAPSPHTYAKSAVRSTLLFVNCSSPPAEYAKECDDRD
jgi:hypothetical protein